MNKEYLESIRFSNISILNINDNGPILIFICEDVAKCIKLYEYIDSNKYAVKIGMRIDKTYKIRLEFPDKGLFLEVHVKKTSVEYPPLEWMISGKVKSLRECNVNCVS